MKQILFCSSFIYNSSNGASIFSRVLLQWAENRQVKLDIITSEELNDLTFIPLVKSNHLVKKIPVLEAYQRSYLYFKTIQAQLKSNNYDFILFNNVIESLHSSKLITEIPIYAFLHDENFMNDYYPNPGLKRKWYRQTMKKLEQKAARQLNRIFTNSLFMKRQIESIYKIEEKLIDFFYFTSLDLKSKKIGKELLSEKSVIHILFIKHDYKRGGFSLLNEAIRSIKSPKIILRAIGPEQGNHNTLTSDQHVVEIYENRSRQEIENDFQWADIFCTPSFSEAMGIGNFEAMKNHVPIVAQNIPVNQEFNRYAEIMFTSDYDDQASLTQAILDCIHNDTKRINLINEAAKFHENYLDKDFIFKKLDQYLL